MTIHTRLTTADDIAARGASTSKPTATGTKPERSEEEKAARRDRVEKAKKALADSQTLKGDHVVAARAALKAFLRNLNDAKQPNDEQFEAILAAHTVVPKKEKPGGFGGGFGGGGGGRGGPGGAPRGPGGPGGPGGATRPGGPPRGPGGPGGGAGGTPRT